MSQFHDVTDAEVDEMIKNADKDNDGKIDYKGRPIIMWFGPGHLYECHIEKAGIHSPNMDPPDNYQTTYDSKTKIVVFYSVSKVFDLISGSKFREDTYLNILK